MSSTLRIRLTVWHLALVGTILTLFTALLYAVLSNSLHRHHDDELEKQARAVSSYLQGLDVTETTAIRALVAGGVSSRFVMIRESNGELLFREPALAATEPNIGRHSVLTHVAASRPSAPEFFTVTLERSGEVRFICVPLGHTERFLQIGDPVGDIRAILNALVRASLALIPIVMGLSSLGSWWLARRALQPVNAIGAALHTINATDLDRRVQVEARDPELTALVSALNHLLDRLQRAFESLQHFAGDVSHQVQTPLTVMKNALEAAHRRSESSQMTAGTFAVLTQQVDGMSATLAQLQILASAEAPIGRATSMDFSEVVLEAVEIVAALGEVKGVEVVCRVAGDVSVRGDGTRLRQIVLNLGENAVKYTPTGGHVTIRLERRDHEAILTVSDTGVGITLADQPHVFDRYFRAGAEGKGLGLGLAIAKRIAEAHAGTIFVHSGPGVGATFTVRLPAGSERLARNH